MTLTSNEFLGTWIAVDGENAGEKLEGRFLNSIELDISADLMRLNHGGTHELVSYAIDPSTEPKTIRFTNGFLKAVGIFSYDNGHLRFCVNFGDETPPTNFVSEKGSMIGVLVLKRKSMESQTVKPLR